MGTHIICPYKEVDKNFTGYNLKTMELLDCALIGACVVIRSNAVIIIKLLPYFNSIITLSIGIDMLQQTV